MCIAIIKPIGARLPSDDMLENCYWGNPDGCGFTYSRNGKVHINKGFFEFEKFKIALKDQVKDGDAALIHFRIATHGKVVPGLTHPFPVCEDFDEMRKLESVCDIAMAHNGILHSTYADDVSDTMSFARLLSETNVHNLATCDQQWRHVLEMMIRGSRVAILWSSGRVDRFGGGWILKDDVYFSNNSFERPKFDRFSWAWDGWKDNYPKKALASPKDGGASSETEEKYFKNDLTTEDVECVRYGICPICSTDLVNGYCPDCCSEFDIKEDDETLCDC